MVNLRLTTAAVRENDVLLMRVIFISQMLVIPENDRKDVGQLTAYLLHAIPNTFRNKCPDILERAYRTQNYWS